MTTRPSVHWALDCIEQWTLYGCHQMWIDQMCILWLYNRGRRPSQWPPEHLDVQLAPNGQYPALLHHTLHCYIIPCCTATSYPALLCHTLHCYIISCTDATSYSALNCIASLHSAHHWCHQVTQISNIYGERKKYGASKWSHQYQFQ